VSGAPPRRSGGRPTAKAAAKLETIMLDAATAAFLAQGYAATTIEGVARAPPGSASARCMPAGAASRRCSERWWNG
jgi:hypothetical protein